MGDMGEAVTEKLIMYERETKEYLHSNGLIPLSIYIQIDIDAGTSARTRSWGESKRGTLY